MEIVAALGDLRADDSVLLLVLVGLLSATVSCTAFMACVWWYRRERRRTQKKMVSAMISASRDCDELFLTGSDITACGELIAQFKVNHGKQVLSVLESDGKRFIHIDGELSAPERAKMVRYLKSEGFMS